MSLPDGTPIWFELVTPDPDEAADFYAALFAWDVRASQYAEHGGYRIAHAADGDQIAGIMAPPPAMATQASTGWSVYFHTADLAGALARAAGLGARIVFGPMEIPRVGRFAKLIDPQGVGLTLLETAEGSEMRPFRQTADALGHGVWIELATPDPDGAFAFYGSLFGWEKAGVMPMGPMGDYAFLGAGEARPGAVMSSGLTGAPARWSAYFLVADIDAALAAATAGGRVTQGPDPIPGGDYSAQILDPHGHAIGVVGPRTGAGR